MNKKLTFFFLAVMYFTSPVFAQFGGNTKQIFESPNLKSEISSHKTVAILPFDVSINYKKQPRNFSYEANKEQEQKMSTSIQSSMYTYMLRKSKDFTVSFQDVDKTNILLKKNGMLNKLDSFTKDEICKALGVDAVLSGKYLIEQTKSEAGAIASAVILGGFGGKTGTGSLVLTLNNGSNGDLLWRFTKTLDDNITTSTDDVVEHMMRKVARNFPYSK